MLEIDGFIAVAHSFADRIDEIDTMNRAFLDGHRSAKAMLEFTKNRIADAKVVDEKRKAELQKKLAEPGKPEPVRKILQSELAEIERKVYAPTQQEKAAFQNELQSGRMMLEEINEAMAQLQLCYSALKADCEKLYKEIRTSKPADVGATWLDGIEKDFSYLTK